MISRIRNIFKKPSIDSVNSSSGLEFEGVYVSEPCFERLDQTWFRYYFRFYRDGSVRYRATTKDFDVGKIYAEDKGIKGTYIVKAGKVVFDLSLPEYSFTSTWSGTIKNDAIVFKIVNPDYEDIDGEYKFVSL